MLPHNTLGRQMGSPSSRSTPARSTRTRRRSPCRSRSPRSRPARPDPRLSSRPTPSSGEPTQWQPPAPTSPARSAAARRPSPASASCRAPASGSSTAAPWRTTSRTRSTSRSVKEPFTTLERGDGLRRHRASSRRRHLRPGRRAAPRHRPRAHRGSSTRAARHPQEGRLPDPRPARQGAEEVRPEEGPQGSPVLQALIACGGSPRRESPGARSSGPTASAGSPTRDLTPQLALVAGDGSRGVLGDGRSGRRSRPLVVGRDTRAVGRAARGRRGRGLAAAGADVLLMSASLPTPGGRACRRRGLDADLGVVLSRPRTTRCPTTAIKFFGRRRLQARRRGPRTRSRRG